MLGSWAIEANWIINAAESGSNGFLANAAEIVLLNVRLGKQSPASLQGFSFWGRAYGNRHFFIIPMSFIHSVRRIGQPPRRAGWLSRSPNPWPTEA